MYQALQRDSGLFEPKVVDELNNAFSKTNTKIEEFSPTPLAFKDSTSLVSFNSVVDWLTISKQNSFAINGVEYWINVVFTFTQNKEIKERTKIAEISTEVPNKVFLELSEASLTLNSFPIEIEGRDVYLGTVVTYEGKTATNKLLKDKNLLLAGNFLK